MKLASKFVAGMTPLIAIRKRLERHAQTFECLLIFAACLFIYLANGRLISSNDSIPHSILAFNWLKNGTLYFDDLRGGQYYDPNALYGSNGLPYFFAEAANGHLTSAYPIGTAIVSFPLYVLFFGFLKLSTLFDWSNFLSILDLSDPSFDLQRRFFEKLAGAILTALAAVIFYLAVRLKFSRAVAIVSTFIYAFATLNWAISAQGLWVHTVTNLILVSILLCLLKANRTQNQRQAILLLTAGFFCGLLPGIRPTSLLFTVTILAYSLLTYRQAAKFVFLGSLSFLFNAAWNIHFFGFSFKSLLVGGYSKLLGTSSGSYKFGDLQYSKEAFLGLLFSPNRGFFVYSPIVVFAISGIRQVFRRSRDPDERLLAWLTIASLILFIHYCFYVPWWGAITYGSRFFIDILPVVCYLISYFIARLFAVNWRKPFWMVISTLFILALMFSTFVQVVGAFSDPHNWDVAPNFSLTRFWDWQDSQIERHARNLYLKFDPPIKRPRRYVKQLKGEVRKIGVTDGQLLSDPLKITSLQQMNLSVKLKNTGRSRWYGYDTGLIRGRTIVQVEFLDSDNRETAMVFPNLLYVKGSPRKGEAAIASGTILFPEEPGEYRMIFTLRAQQLSEPATTSPPYEIKAIVQPASVAPNPS